MTLLANHLPADHAARALRADVDAGLRGTPKSLPPKWFYDETGSALFDRITRLPEYYPTRTEAAILAKLRPVMARCTTLIVSHRISTLGCADFVVVIEEGRVTQTGRPGDLEAQPGYYRDMSRMQAVEQDLEAGA